jgi:hypothetical protein
MVSSSEVLGSTVSRRLRFGEIRVLCAQIGEGGRMIVIVGLAVAQWKDLPTYGGGDSNVDGS